LTDDVEWTEWGSPEGPLRHQGKAEFEKNMNAPPGPGGLRIEVHRLTEEGDVVLAECTVHVPLEEGRPLGVHAWDIFEMHRGKIRRLTAITALEKAGR
jgi:ketosteroid isomerase-like protein